MKSKPIVSLLLITILLSGVVVYAESSEMKKPDDYFLIGELYGLKYIQQVCDMFGLKPEREGGSISLSNGMEFTSNGRAIKKMSPLELDDSTEVFQRTKQGHKS